MTATTPIARKEIFGVVRAALAPFPGLVVKWQGVDSLDPPSGGTDWVRVEVQHDDGGQNSLSGPINGAMRWRRSGIITVQCFAQQAPVAPAGALVGIDKASQYACAVRDAFQGRATESGVWFRRPTTREVGPDKHWYQVNATIFFEYDEVTSHDP